VSTDDLQLLVGQVLDGRYRLDDLLGQGGMGAVFRGYQLAMERRVAVKVLRPHLVGDPVAARRFVREARGTFKVDNQHAVKVHDFSAADDGTLYMVMEYLDGRTVGAELAVDGPLAPGRAIHVARQVAAALDAAHRIGLVHRDIKPDNIMLMVRGSDPDFAKVLDFGLAKLADDALSGPFSRVALTQGDVVFGTPDYMSPEQAKGQSLDGRSDIYALGATLFEMLTGRPPFVESSPMLLLARHVQAPPPHLGDLVGALGEGPGAAELDAVVQRCLAKAPSKRPGTAAALVEELDRVTRALAPRRMSRDERSPASTMDLDAPEPTPATAALEQAATQQAPAWSGGGGGIGFESSPIAPAGSGRAGWIAAVVGGLAVVAIAAVALASRGRKAAATTGADAAGAGAASIRTAGSGSGSAATRPADAGAAAAMAADAGVIAVASPPDARAVTEHVHERVHDHVHGRGGGHREEAKAHLAAARAAKAEGNRLRQLAEADLALRADPHLAEARLLLGDALIATGDKRKGCSYLRSVKRLVRARTAAAAAGCPAD
jgi:eukaryotic-like serine/threonine-protein kinase